MGEATIFLLVMDIHGGGWKQGSKNFQRLNFDHRCAVKNRFVYARINYRFSHEEPFPAALLDVMNAVRFLRIKAEAFAIDPDRIALYGSSAGGHLTVLAAYAAHHEPFEEGNRYPQAQILDWKPSR